MHKLFIFVNLFALSWAAGTPLDPPQAVHINSAAAVVVNNLHRVGTNTKALFSSAQKEIANALDDGICSYLVEAPERSLDASLRQLFCTLKTEVPNGADSLRALLQVLRSDALFPKPTFGRFGIVITPEIGLFAILNKFKSISGYTF